ncbi:MAG TPA: hypothetical protein VKD91_18645 [Pyrinomonadaceae bacterium]|nr:hypothetical protein [Pyrinomonadaceae bacterium]
MVQAIDNTIIVLIGFAGTGKYTIGRELAGRTGAKLIDNHLINNSLFTAVNADGVTPLPVEIWPKITRIRQIVYETIRELSPRELSFIFTVQLIEEDPTDHAAFANMVELAEARGSLLVPIRLLCEIEELCRRVVSPSRAAMLKQISADSTRKTLAAKTVLHPVHPNLRTIDVTQSSAIESAMTILESVRSITGYQ